MRKHWIQASILLSLLLVTINAKEVEILRDSNETPNILMKNQNVIENKEDKGNYQAKTASNENNSEEQGTRKYRKNADDKFGDYYDRHVNDQTSDRERYVDYYDPYNKMSERKHFGFHEEYQNRYGGYKDREHKPPSFNRHGSYGDRGRYRNSFHKNHEDFGPREFSGRSRPVYMDGKHGRYEGREFWENGPEGHYRVSGPGRYGNGVFYRGPGKNSIEHGGYESRDYKDRGFNDIRSADYKEYMLGNHDGYMGDMYDGYESRHYNHDHRELQPMEYERYQPYEGKGYMSFGGKRYGDHGNHHGYGNLRHENNVEGYHRGYARGNHGDYLYKYPDNRYGEHIGYRDERPKGYGGEGRHEVSKHYKNYGESGGSYKEHSERVPSMDHGEYGGTYGGGKYDGSNFGGVGGKMKYDSSNYGGKHGGGIYNDVLKHDASTIGNKHASNPSGNSGIKYSGLGAKLSNQSGSTKHTGYTNRGKNDGKQLVAIAISTTTYKDGKNNRMGGMGRMGHGGGGGYGQAMMLPFALASVPRMNGLGYGGQAMIRGK